MQKLGDIESLTGQGFRSRSIAHSSIGSHRDESRRLSRLTPPHRASHEVRDVDCRRPEHATGGPVEPPCSPRVQPTRAGTQPDDQEPEQEQSGSHSPSSRIGAVQPSRLHGRRVPSRLRLVHAHQVEQQPYSVSGGSAPTGMRPQASRRGLPPDTAHGMRQLGACCRTPSPLQGTSMGPAPAGGADPDRSASVCDRKATTCGHWKPLVTYPLRSGPAV